MGAYLNCGNTSFRQILNSIYVDKTGLIEYVNSTLDTYDRMTCVSRPRRFGKSFSTKMLAAYYDESCDSKELFQNLKVAKSNDFYRYLNKFSVIYLDITHFISRTKDIKNIINDIQKCIIDDLKNTYPAIIKENETYLLDALFTVTQ